MKVKLVRVQPGAFRVFANGLHGNPPPPVEVYECDSHGEFFHFRWGRPECYPCQREARRRSAEARRAPKPHTQRGTCTLCGTSPLPGRRTSWCSDDCVRLWEIATSGRSALLHLRGLHGSVCFACGAPARRLEVDHIRPLWSLTDHQRSDLRWWLPFNLQLLCEVCHKAKTRWEASLRAMVRRSETKWRPWAGPESEDPAPLFEGAS